MTIIIHTENKTISLDNDSMMADEGMIALGEATKDMFIDGEVTKERAKEIIEEYVKEFFKWSLLKIVSFMREIGSVQR